MLLERHVTAFQHRLPAQERPGHDPIAAHQAPRGGSTTAVRLVTLGLAPLALAAMLGDRRAPVPWWEREPLRIVHVITSLDRIDALSPADLAAWKAAQLYNVEHLEVMGMSRKSAGGGLDDQQFFFVSKAAARGNPDYLRAYLAEAHRLGIRVFVYFNVHWYTSQFGEQHPDWRQVRENGTPLDGVYDAGTDLCVNTPWREWVFQVLRDLAAYPIDGVFYDGPIYRADTCYCPYCRRKFRDLHGRPLPSKRERRGRDFKALVDFQAASLAEFLRDSRRVLKAANPELAFYMNGGLRGANWATGRLNRVLVAEQDLLGAEGGFISSDLTRVPLWKPGLTARLLETQAGGKPRVIFIAASHKPWTFSLLPAPELKLLYADTIANAASVWMGITPFEMSQPEMQAVAAMNRFLADNGAYYRGTRSEARAAVVWSDVTANSYAAADAPEGGARTVRPGGAGNLEAEFGGLAEALVRSHVPFDVIDDATLEREPLGRYQALFLPNVGCMSDRAAARIREYVRQGGSLFATFETSLYDEAGLHRGDFALADVFGASVAGAPAGPRRWDFIQPAGAHSLLDGLGRALLPSPAYYVPLAPKGARVLARFTHPLVGRYDGVPAVTDDPAFLVSSFGKGTAVYSSGDIGAAIAEFHTPELLSLVENAVSQLSPPAVLLDNVPSSVEVVLRSQDEGRRLLLHLVNFTGEMTRPIRRVVPVSNASVTLVDDRPVARVRTLVSRRELPIGKDSRGRPRFDLPRFEEYEVAVIER
jgi:hypothetical protein